MMNQIQPTRPNEERTVHMSQRDAYRLMLRDYPDVLNIEQVCEVLKVSTKTGYNLLRKGTLQSLKVGRAYRIPKAYLLEYLLSEFEPQKTCA